MVTPDVIKMDVEEEEYEKKYIMYYLNSETARKTNEERSFGTTRLRITLPLFRSTPIPITSLAEQKVDFPRIRRQLYADFYLFEINRTEHPQLRMPSYSVVEDFDVVKDIGTGLLSG